MESVAARYVSPGLPALFAAAVPAGRSFVGGEGRSGTGKVAMLDYGAWQRRFGGRATVIGEHITVDNEPVAVVGVMPPRREPRLL